MQILIFGDSIAYGCWDSEGGWVARLRKYVDEKITELDKGYYHELFNLGIPSENSPRVLARLSGEIKSRLEKHGECAVIFSIGTNDSNYLIAEKRNRISLEDFERNIRAMVATAGQFTKQIIFVGTLLADEAKVNPCPWAPDKTYFNEHICNYDAVVQKIAGELSLQYIDVATPFIAAGGVDLLDDGIYPTTEGHHVIFETVRDALIEKGLV